MLTVLLLQLLLHPSPLPLNILSTFLPHFSYLLCAFSKLSPHLRNLALLVFKGLGGLAEMALVGCELAAGDLGGWGWVEEIRMEEGERGSRILGFGGVVRGV